MTEEELNKIGTALPHVGTLKLIAEIRRLEAERDWLVEEVCQQTGVTLDHLRECMEAPNHKPVVNVKMGEKWRDIFALQAENAALRARAVPEVVWSDPTDITPARAKFGKLLLIAWEDGEWRILFGEEQLVEGDTADLETAKSACVASFLRLVGVQ